MPKQAQTAKPLLSKTQKLLKVMSILSLIGGIFLIILSLMLIVGAGLTLALGSSQDLAEALGVSEESARIFLLQGFALVLLDGILSLLRGLRGLIACKNPLALKSFTALSQMLVAVEQLPVLCFLRHSGALGLRLHRHEAPARDRDHR